MIAGNVLSFGGGKAPVIGYVWHRNSSSTYTTVASSASALRVYDCDSKYFDLTDGVFTCVKPGTYTLVLFARGGRTGNGTETYCRYRLYINSDIVKSVTSNSIGNAGVTDTATVTLAAGDILYLKTATNSGTYGHDMGMVIQNV